ncbi:MAG TPA: PP2C family protein-serine/threonine phosphatase [Acidobacteriota bacterium]
MTELVGLPLDELKDDVISMRGLQRRIMPAASETVVFDDYDIYGRTVPLAIVGGDFYDFVELERKFGIKNRFGIIIADASGHGLSAAMLIRDFNTAIYTGISFQSHYEKETTPLLFNEINKRMYNSSQPNQFISAFYGELHLDGLFKYINAGHLAPIVLKGNNEIIELNEGGPVLGAVYDFGGEYRVGSINVAPEDVLTLFTDGIVEATNRKGEEFGLHRLVETIARNRKRSSRQIFSAIVNRVKRFRSEISDDLTLIVVKHGGRLKRSKLKKA